MQNKLTKCRINRVFSSVTVLLIILSLRIAQALSANSDIQEQFTTSTVKSEDCPSKIPLIFHQTYKERQLPTQYVFSVSSIARNHRIACNNTPENISNCDLFKYYFWTDESIKEFVEDEKRFDPLFTKMESGLQLARLADFAYHFLCTIL